MPGKDAVIFFQLNPFQPFLFPKKKEHIQMFPN